MTGTLRFLAIARMLSMSATDPPMWTGMMALVRSVMAASSLAGFIRNVSRSQSTKMGKAWWSSTTLTVARKVYGGTMTSSPGPTPRAPSDENNAVVPLDVATQYLAPFSSA